MKLFVLFYHPKNPLNLRDVAELAKTVGAEVLAVKRPGTERFDVHGVKWVSSIEEAVSLLPENTVFVVLETYAQSHLHELELEDAEFICLVLGAEDYGIPPSEVSKLPRAVLARMPMAVQGASYNVAATAAMAIYELLRRLESRGRER